MKNIILLFRFKHYVKNLFVFIPLVFSGLLFNVDAFINTFVAFIYFCIGASFVYIINDIIDADKDKLHPIKQKRPIASGKIKKKNAITLAFVLLLVIFTEYFILRPVFFITIGYIILNIFYAFFLKNVSILDLLSISIGFVLRVEAGVFSNELSFSNWLIIMTFSLSMLLVLGKRRAELTIVGDNRTRGILNNYSIQFIKTLQMIFATITLIVYLLYTFFNVNFHGNQHVLFFSSIFVFYGVLRYLQITDNDNYTEDVTSILYTERSIIFAILFWIIFVIISLYL